jgi:hypothetical protein
MHVDHHPDLAVRHAIGGQHDDPGPFGYTGLDRSRSGPTLQYFTVTRSQLQRQQSHHPMKHITVINATMH